MVNSVKVLHQSTPSAALPHSETSKTRRFLLEPVTSCGDELVCSLMPPLNFSVWLLIPSSRSPLWVETATRMFLSVFGGWFESLEQGNRDGPHPFVKASGLCEKHKAWQRLFQRKSFSPLTFPLSSTVFHWQKWVTDCSGMKSWDSLIGWKIYSLASSFVRHSSAFSLMLM